VAWGLLELEVKDVEEVKEVKGQKEPSYAFLHSFYERGACYMNSEHRLKWVSVDAKKSTD
jgi:hypothetical protein